MEGTRLTIVKVPTQPDAFEFSIRTPVTPPRWKDFEQVTHASSCGLLACDHMRCKAAWRREAFTGLVTIEI